MALPFRTIAVSGCCVLGAFAQSAYASSASARDGVSAPYDVSLTAEQAPFGDAVSADIVNYSRAAPYVAVAGALKGDGVAEAKRLGFRLIIDLRQPAEEGVAENAAQAEALGMKRLQLPFTSDDTVAAQIDVLEAAFDDAANYPILLHCASANRAAAVWALYRARLGVDPITALEEARAIGPKSREPFVREQLGLPVAEDG